MPENHKALTDVLDVVLPGRTLQVGFKGLALDLDVVKNGAPHDDDEFTVVGVWQGCEPIAVGVIRGRHDVTGGDMQTFTEGVWALSVNAGSDEEAQGDAVASMKANDYEDEKDFTGGPVVPDGFTESLGFKV